MWVKPYVHMGKATCTYLQSHMCIWVKPHVHMGKATFVNWNAIFIDGLIHLCNWVNPPLKMETQSLKVGHVIQLFSHSIFHTCFS